MTLPNVLAWLVILLAVPVHWIMVWRLWHLSRARPDLRVLRDRAETALGLAVVVSLFALVFLNNGMEVPFLDPFATMVITRSAILALSIPALRWLWLYRNGRRP